ncbi:hypothetical protein [Bradyrhizobium sp.]|uniref:hypothetical protein n=1 Tax=Bradyrhizobium sp. TaxID=376 RepID=UPI004037D290
MRKKLFGAAVSAAVVGGLLTPAFSQAPAPAKTSGSQKNPGPQTSANSPKRPIPPQLVKQCTAYLAPRLGSTKIVGPFSEGSFSHPLAKWVWEKKRLIIGAPSITTGLFGQVSKGYVGCMFAVENGGFEFVKPLGGEAFPPRYTRAPGDPK